LSVYVNFNDEIYKILLINIYINLSKGKANYSKLYTNIKVTIKLKIKSFFLLVV